MNRSLIQLTLIHFREFLREPGILFWALFFPILMAWVLGIAFSSKPVTIQTFAVVKESNAIYEPLTRFLAEATSKLNSDKKLEITRILEDDKLGRTSFRAAPGFCAMLTLSACTSKGGATFRPR